jgi:hypothetical protein
MHRSKNFHSTTSSAPASNTEAERLCGLEIDHQFDFVDLGRADPPTYGRREFSRHKCEAVYTEVVRSRPNVKRYTFALSKLAAMGNANPILLV